ncbi:class I SAM-dependent methyltransferase [Euzebyella marina]|nr:class I SAM-dependent methyltransferase [Euzebyella marina]
MPVTAFDISDTARQKAMTLAKSQNALIDYKVSSVLDFYSERQFDVVAFIYAHFPSDIRKQASEKILSLVRPGGKVIFEAFSKEQLSLESGGAKDEKMLFSLEEMEEEFKFLEFYLLRKEKINLNEGQYHKGKASVIRMVGTKK